MPCNTVQTNTVELGKVKDLDLDLLEKALRGEFGEVERRGDTLHFSAEGYRVTLRNGRAESTMFERTLEKTVGRVKQAYSRAAVQLAARRFGWATVDVVDANHFSLVKD